MIFFFGFIFLDEGNQDEDDGAEGNQGWLGLVGVIEFFQVQVGLNKGLVKVTGELFVFESEGLMLVRNININAEEANKIMDVGVELLGEFALENGIYFA